MVVDLTVSSNGGVFDLYIVADMAAAAELGAGADARKRPDATTGAHECTRHE